LLAIEKAKLVRNQVGSVVRGDDFFGRDGFVRQVSEKLREAVGKEKEDFDEFAGMMTDLEYEFYVYQFACKILRDWRLRHYAL
jgi:hypothetical protein